MSEFSHIPVLLDECIDNLQIKPDGTYVDGTVGGGGHSGEILKKLGSGGFLIGIDRDAEAIEAAGSGLASVLKESNTGARFTLVHGNYADMCEICHGLGVERVDGILLDLGGYRIVNAAGSGTDIASGPATSGATSNWAFKLSGTGVVAAYQSFTTVPASATKVATSNAAASEVEIDTGYQVYISATQQADTYEGKVTYTVAKGA